MPSGVIAIDRQGALVLINRAAMRILGLREAGSMIGRPCRDVLASYPEIARVLLDGFDTQTPPNRAELELRHARRTGPTIGYTLSSVRAAHGEVIGAVMLFRDLTRIERLEEQARLRDRLAVLGQMAAGLAHEMRNPLAAIEIHAGLLRRILEPSHTAQLESVDHILAETHRLNEAVGTALDFVRPVEPVEQKVRIEPLLESLVAAPGAREARIERDYAVGGTVALGDASQLRQAFGNLLRNAREAAGPDGTVWVRTRAVTPGAGQADEDAPFPPDRAAGTPAGEVAESGEGGQVAVEVTDDGPGIPEEHRDRIFQPFFTTKPRGSGLGLAMVQKIVQGHHGRVDLTSEPGRGTTFRVFLRAAPSEPSR